MSAKNALKYKVASSQSLSSTFTSSPTDIRYLDNCSYQINITTSNSTGSFSIQGSNDFEPSPQNAGLPVNPGNWADLPLSGTPTVAASNDVIVIDLNQLSLNGIRLHYTSTVAGTGLADIWLVSKRLGG